MNARPVLERIAAALAHANLECILIGNAAAALQGAPVTTLDFDFFFRDTPTNRRKLIRFAKELNAIVLRPYTTFRFKLTSSVPFTAFDPSKARDGVHRR